MDNLHWFTDFIIFEYIIQLISYMYVNTVKQCNEITNSMNDLRAKMRSFSIKYFECHLLKRILETMTKRAKSTLQLYHLSVIGFFKTNLILQYS